MKNNIGTETPISTVLIHFFNPPFFPFVLASNSSQAQFCLLLFLDLLNSPGSPSAFLFGLKLASVCGSEPAPGGLGITDALPSRNKENCFVNSGKTKLFFLFPVERVGPLCNYSLGIENYRS